MVNMKLFKSKAALYEYTIEDLAKELNISTTSMSLKLNRPDRQFNQSEIALLVDRLFLSPDETMSIFFTT